MIHGLCSVCVMLVIGQSSAFGCIDTVIEIKYYIYFCILLGFTFSLLIFILICLICLIDIRTVEYKSHFLSLRHVQLQFG